MPIVAAIFLAIRKVYSLNPAGTSSKFTDFDAILASYQKDLETDTGELTFIVAHHVARKENWHVMAKIATQASEYAVLAALYPDTPLVNDVSTRALAGKSANFLQARSTDVDVLVAFNEPKHVDSLIKLLPAFSTADTVARPVCALSLLVVKLIAPVLDVGGGGVIWNTYYIMIKY